jgi:hypothetical protein
MAAIIGFGEEVMRGNVVADEEERRAQRRDLRG